MKDIFSRLLTSRFAKSQQKDEGKSCKLNENRNEI